jgi:hypothetical protein
MKKWIFMLVFALPCFLAADFTGMNWGARPMAMGNAYLSLADDPPAMFWNPARMAVIEQLSISASHETLYGISDFSNQTVAIGFPLPFVKMGIGWTQINLKDVYTERIAYLSASSIIWLHKTPLRFGMNVKHYYAKVHNYTDADSPSNLDFDLGIDTNLAKNLTAGFVVRNLFEPEFQFIQQADKVEREMAFGVAYRWLNSVHFACDYVASDSQSEWNIGGEMWFFNVFAPRIGMSGEDFTAGFGLKGNNWQLDGAALSQEALGSTYRLTFMWKFDLLKRAK